MFGHQNNNDQANAGQNHPAPTADGQLSAPEPEMIAPTAASAPPVTSNDSDYGLPEVPQTAAPVPAAPVASTPAVTPASPSSPAPAIVPADHRTSSAPSATEPAEANDLLELKQSALHELSPLVNQLEQTPEEKFRTTMMMIQASDDQTLLQTAFQAAKSIPDEKARAQALLDVVNEINYFTQQHEN